MWKTKKKYKPAKISMRNKMMLTMYLCGGMTYKELGEKFSISTERAKQVCHQTLRQVIGNHTNDQCPFLGGRGTRLRWFRRFDEKLAQLMFPLLRDHYIKTEKTRLNII